MSKTLNEHKLTTSKKLIEIHKSLPDTTITLKQLIDAMSGEGVQFLIIILLAPFLIPASIPGSSTPFGVLIILLEVSFLRNTKLYLPDFIGKYELSQSNVLKLFEILEKILGYIEKISKPRGQLSTKKHILQLNAIIGIVLAFLLFLPLPIPFTDFIPSFSMLILAVSTLERDSYLMIVGYVAAILSVIYFAYVGYMGIEVIIYTLKYIGIPI